MFHPPLFLLCVNYIQYCSLFWETHKQALETFIITLSYPTDLDFIYCLHSHLYLNESFKSAFESLLTFHIMKIMKIQKCDTDFLMTLLENALENYLRVFFYFQCKNEKLKLYYSDRKSSSLQNTLPEGTFIAKAKSRKYELCLLIYDSFNSTLLRRYFRSIYKQKAHIRVNVCRKRT